MYVTDSLTPPPGMKIRVINMSGKDCILDVSPSMKIDDIKVMTLKNIEESADSMKSSLYHKIILVRTGKVLDGENTAEEERIMDNDELLLLRKRLQPFICGQGSDVLSGTEKNKITQEDIIAATGAFPMQKSQPLPPLAHAPGDFQSEMRKILRSLIEASQRILCLDPSSAKVFQQVEDILKEKPQEAKVDEQLIKKLVDMGFPESRAKKALLLNKMSVISAMEWLIEHSGDKDIDAPLQPADIPKEETEIDEESQGAVGGVESEASVKNMLKVLHAYKHRKFKPNLKALQNLMEMGFSEEESIAALRYSRNDQGSACDWLLGDRKRKGDDSDEELDPNSSLYKAIMSNPTVQLGLSNPRCLIAFIHMLESPMMTHQWINVPETGPILVLISRIYHSEKHTAQVESASKSSSKSTSSLPDADAGSSVDPEPESESRDNSVSSDEVDGVLSPVNDSKPNERLNSSREPSHTSMSSCAPISPRRDGPEAGSSSAPSPALPRTSNSQLSHSRDSGTNPQAQKSVSLRKS